MLNPKSTEAYLISKPENIFYLTHFDGEGYAIVTSKEIYLATDQRYWLLAKAVKKKGVKLIDIKHGWHEELQETLKKTQTIFYEEHQLTIAGLERWKQMLPKKKWKKGNGAVEALRLIKNEEELQHLTDAAAIGDKVLKKVLSELKPGVTELEVANRLRYFSQEYAEGISFPPIVAFGENGAIPHHHSGLRKLKKDDAILIDQGVRYQHYMSDMTRCYFIGKGIPEIQAMYDQLLEVQQAGVNMVRAGVTISELSAAVRAMLGKDHKYFTHSLGHGVGLEVHEAPGVSMRSDDVLQAGMVITIEPGLYKAGIGGIRIEDTVIVTEDGCEVITKSSKKPQLP